MFGDFTVSDDGEPVNLVGDARADVARPPGRSSLASRFLIAS